MLFLLFSRILQPLLWIKTYNQKEGNNMIFIAIGVMFIVIGIFQMSKGKD